MQQLLPSQSPILSGVALKGIHLMTNGGFSPHTAHKHLPVVDLFFWSLKKKISKKD